MPTEHDPFAPHHTVGAYADDPEAFPARRLLRAGLGDQAILHLRGWYEQASPEQQSEWRDSVHRAPDQAIKDRFVQPETDLEHLTVPQLHELLRAAGQPVGGNKADLIARLTAETPSQPAGGDGGGAPPEEPSGAPDGGEEQPGGADGPPDGQPPNEQPTTEEPQTGVQQPPDPAEQPNPQGQPGAPQEPPHEPPVTAPQPEARRSTPRRSGGTGPGART